MSEATKRSYEEFQQPPVPADCDLRGFEFMPLVTTSLRGSRTWLRFRQRPDLAFCYLNLLTAAWQSLPASSLEDDDLVLADAAMCDLGRWLEVRSEVIVRVGTM
jgi:hypothetical protein